MMPQSEKARSVCLSGVGRAHPRDCGRGRCWHAARRTNCLNALGEKERWREGDYSEGLLSGTTF